MSSPASDVVIFDDMRPSGKLIESRLRLARLSVDYLEFHFHDNFYSMKSFKDAFCLLLDQTPAPKIVVCDLHLSLKSLREFLAPANFVTARVVYDLIKTRTDGWQNALFFVLTDSPKEANTMFAASEAPVLDKKIYLDEGTAALPRLLVPMLSGVAF